MQIFTGYSFSFSKAVTRFSISRYYSQGNGWRCASVQNRLMLFYRQYILSRVLNKFLTKKELTDFVTKSVSSFFMNNLKLLSKRCHEAFWNHKTQCLCGVSAFLILFPLVAGTCILNIFLVDIVPAILIILIAHIIVAIRWMFIKILSVVINDWERIKIIFPGGCYLDTIIIRKKQKIKITYRLSIQSSCCGVTFLILHLIWFVKTCS